MAMGHKLESERWVQRYKESITPALGKYTTIVFRSGRGMTLTDVDGKTYLDFSSGIATTNVGHCHPVVINAIKEQAERLIHISGHVAIDEGYVLLAEKLRALSSGELKGGKLFFCNSGGEAVEGSLKVARFCSQKLMVVSFMGAFHGRTMGSLGLTGSRSSYKKRLTPLMAGTVMVPYAYCYRCAYGQTYPECHMHCLEYLENVWGHVVPVEDVAAIIAEPIQGEGGYIVPPDEFMPELRKICNENDILLIADEVQTGFGRTGKMFAYQHSNIVPDVVAMAKGIAAGMPLGAFLAKREVMDAWESGSHGSTYGGNPLSTAAALASISVIEEGSLIDNAQKVGALMLRRLRDMMGEHELIGDVRGRGLMIGVELVKDRKTKERASDETKQVRAEAVKRGLLLIGAGENVIRIAPPLIITREEAERGLDILEEALSAVEGR